MCLFISAIFPQLLIILLLNGAGSFAAPALAPNVFDLGLLDSCVQPTSQQLSSCSEYVDYLVPGVLLSQQQLNIKHKRIAAAHSKALHQESSAGNASMAVQCAQSVLRQQCKEEFPQCFTEPTSNQKMVKFTANPCMSDTNPCTHHEPSCGVDANVSLATCHPVTNHSSSYSYCSTLAGWSETYVTSWMHLLLQEVEQDIDNFQSAFVNEIARSKCVPLYTELQCGTVGRCSEQGTRVEMNATREVCQALMNCVGTNLRLTLSASINCSHYPSAMDKLPTVATPITEPPTPLTTDKPDKLTDPVRPTTPSTDAGTQPSEYPTVVFPDQPVRLTSGSSSFLSQSLLLVALSLMTVLCIIMLS